MATWTSLVMLLSIHLAMNHAAVRAVSMHTLNRQRANIVISTMIQQGTVLNPVEVSLRERIFEWDGALRWEEAQVIAKARIGISLQEFMTNLGRSHDATGSVVDAPVSLERLTDLFRLEDYILWYDTSRRQALIMLKDGTTPISQLKAWAHALMTAHNSNCGHAIGARTKVEASMLGQLETTLMELSHRWPRDLAALKAAGWDLGSTSLETTSATRISLVKDR